MGCVAVLGFGLDLAAGRVLCPAFGRVIRGFVLSFRRKAGAPPFGVDPGGPDGEALIARRQMRRGLQDVEWKNRIEEKYGAAMER